MIYYLLALLKSLFSNHSPLGLNSNGKLIKGCYEYYFLEQPLDIGNYVQVTIQFY